MRVAVILESSLYSGGGYQQELSVASLLNKHQSDGREFIFYTSDQENLVVLKARGIHAKYFNKYAVGNMLFLAFFQGWIARKTLHALKLTGASFERTLLRDGIDLVYFLKPSFLSLVLSNMNYVITVWDLCHRDHPEFPEVRSGGEYEYREYLYNHALKKAVAILTDSSLGRLNVARRYGCDIERVYEARFFPLLKENGDTGFDIKAKYSIKNPYVFYPAQFWPHKNHLYILDGLKCLQTRFGITVDAVFSGTDKGNLKDLLTYAREIGLSGHVHYVGFISEEEKSACYKQAVALVMPTYFGPTNIPPLEAFELGCPVCYPDLPGLKDQVGDAALLMDLYDPMSMASHIMTILNEPDVVREKVRKGKIVLSSSTEDAYWVVLKQIFDRYQNKMKLWARG